MTDEEVKTAEVVTSDPVVTTEKDTALAEHQGLREQILTEKGEESPEVTEKKEEPEKPEGEEEVEEYDWDKLKEEFPIIEKMGYKDVKDILSRVTGGVGDLNKAGELLKALKEQGIEDEQGIKEFMLKLKSGDLKKPESQEQEPKTFEEYRKKNLQELIPQETTDEYGTKRPLTEEEKNSFQQQNEAFSERVFPSYLGEEIRSNTNQVTNLTDELEFRIFQLQPLIEANKDKLLGEDVRREITTFYEKYPLSAKEIILEAKKKRQNYYDALYQHFILKTKGDEITDKKVQKILEEREKEAERRSAATTETGKTKSQPLGEKVFNDMSRDEQRAWLKKNQGR